MKKKWIFILLLLLIPVVFADDNLPFDRYNQLMIQHTATINSLIDSKYNQYENFSNDYVAYILRHVDDRIDSMQRQIIVGVLTSFIVGSLIILLFINWYLRKYYRSKWSYGK